jgi:hypothetical protein
MNDAQSAYRPLYDGAWLRYVKEGSDQAIDPQFQEKVTALDPKLVLPIALADANEIRRALAIGEGKLEKLPVATIGANDDCVLARALSNGWSATVSSGETTIGHLADDITFVQVKLALQTLKQLGFVGVYMSPDCEVTEPGWFYYIVIPHTWAMQEFVTWYDKGAFPELVLEGDSDGQHQVTVFQEWIEEGFSISDIRYGRVPAYSY